MSEVEDWQRANDEISRPFIEPHTHSFVVKIWLEETPGETAHPVWRGHITHVASGKRCYVNSLGGLMGFVTPYLTALGIKMPFFERACLWLTRPK